MSGVIPSKYRQSPGTATAGYYYTYKRLQFGIITGKRHPHHFQHIQFMIATGNCKTKPYYAALATALFLVALRSGDAATVAAKSGAFTDVSTAIGLAKPGDIVTVPAGTASWAATLNITKGITLQGAGIDRTIIADNVPLSSKTGDASVINTTLATGQSFRVTGFTFKAGTRTTKPISGAVINAQGTCFAYRIDHIHFDQPIDREVHIGGWIYGVIDHCLFDTRAGAFGSILVQHATWGGGTNNFGDGSWTEPAYFGSEKFLFIEDNVFNNHGTEQTNGIDCYAGGRYVVRHNTFNNCLPLNHGTESPGRLRGSRAVEIYNNVFKFTTGATVGQNRGGGALYHDNTYTGAFNNSAIALNVFREYYPFHTWAGSAESGANGNNRWDANDSHGLYASGTHTGGNGAGTLIDKTKNWVPNQWVGYSITNTTQTLSNGDHYNSYITANTANTITFHVDSTIGAGSAGTAMTFNTGNGYAIYKVLIALDQPGRGKGDLLAGNPPVNKAAGGIAWPNQALEPVYCWNNTVNGSPVNRDYYNGPMPNYKPYTYPHPLTGPAPPTNLAVVSGQ